MLDRRINSHKTALRAKVGAAGEIRTHSALSGRNFTDCYYSQVDSTAWCASPVPSREFPFGGRRVSDTPEAHFYLYIIPLSIATKFNSNLSVNV